MKTLFNILLLLITVTHIHAQKHKVLQKVFETDLNTTAVFNLTGVNVKIQPSIDGKMHFDYELNFKNYSKKEIKEELDKIEVEVTKFDNNIHLESNSISSVHTSFNVEPHIGVVLEDDFFKKSDSIVSTFKRKTKDSILRQVNISPIDEMKSFFKYFKTLDKNGKKVNLRTKNVKVKRTVFIIKIPPYVKLNILAEKSNIYIEDDFLNEISLTSVAGSFKAKHLSNSNNNIEINDAPIKIEMLSNGTYKFKNVKNGLIAKVENINMTSEFSKIEFGEIGKNVKITDFNSELWFYNFSNNFERFDIDAEYTKLNLFYPKDDYSIDAFGYNTIFYAGEAKITMQPNKKGEKFKMFQSKPKGIGVFAGKMYFDIIHGIIRVDDEFIKINQ
ncbi:hypothetical protein [Pontimicrobium sp. SW4]|uniref:Adhesin domain-containing protein n=1 Tax=Pontimicrobium sp. SW4 TaxID=3153519 RepID=A0AAU7BUJ3_9FLAO